jgi:hypothetical protein
MTPEHSRVHETRIAASCVIHQSESVPLFFFPLLINNVHTNKDERHIVSLQLYYQLWSLYILRYIFNCHYWWSDYIWLSDQFLRLRAKPMLAINPSIAGKEWLSFMWREVVVRPCNSALCPGSFAVALVQPEVRRASQLSQAKPSQNIHVDQPQNRKTHIHISRSIGSIW